MWHLIRKLTKHIEKYQTQKTCYYISFIKNEYMYIFARFFFNSIILEVLL